MTLFDESCYGLACKVYEQSKDRYPGMKKADVLAAVGYSYPTWTQHQKHFAGVEEFPKLRDWLVLGGDWKSVGLDVEKPVKLMSIPATVHALRSQKKLREEKGRKRQRRRSSSGNE
jgi:hypothetical protein